MNAWRWAIVGMVLVAGCREHGTGGGGPARGAPPERPAKAPEAATVALARAPGLRESAGLAVATIGARALAFVADADDRAVVTLDAASLETLSRVELDGSPRDVLVTAAGELLVTIPERNLVVALAAEDERGTLHEARRRWTSTEPIAMAETPDDAVILVAAGASHRVDALDAKTLALRWSKPVAREPRAVLVSADGARAFVTHAGDGVVSVLDTTGAGDVARVSLALPAETLTLAEHTIADDPARFARHANAIVRATSRDGREVLRVPVVDEAPVDPAATGGYGGAGGFTELMAPLPMAPLPGAPMRIRRVDTPFGRSALDVQTVDAQRGTRVARRGGRALVGDCLLPRAAIADGERLLVACFGQSSLVEIDTARGWPAVARTFEVPRGPSALARVPGEARAIVWSPLARAVASVSLADERAGQRDGQGAGQHAGGPREAREAREARAPLAVRDVARARPMDAVVLRGRELFHRTGDRAISRDGIACATCHPDGRDDGLVWASPKGQRRPITLAGNESRATPFGWGAEHATMDEHVTETIRRLGGRGLARDDREALFAYIRSMKPVPRAVAEESADARRGERAFRDRGCTGCHDEAAGYSDHLPHEVGGEGPTVTPSLVGVGARDALFHDGRFRGIDDLLARAKDMGNVGALSAAERVEIAAFLREL